MTIYHEDKTSRQPGSEQCWKIIGVMGDATCPRLDEAVHCRNCPVFAEAGQRLFERAAAGRVYRRANHPFIGSDQR